MKKTLTALITTFSLLASIVSPAFAVAQTVSPTSQPLVQQGDMVYLGKFTVPSSDGSGRTNSMDSLDYGSYGIGMGADGQSIYFGCHDWYDMIARISIPAIGGTGTIQMPCTAITNKAAVNPGDVNGFNPGGTLVWNNKLIVTMYPYYDAGGSAVGSHFTMTPTMTSQSGPFRVGALTGSNSSPTDRVGMQSGYMGIVPAEWRSLLGAPAFVGQMGIPIIGRTSFGPSLTVFDPDQLGVSSASTKLLVGYPNEYQTLGGYSQANTLFSGADQLGGAAFPAGTRTVLFVGRHATTFCYGEGTNDPALDRQPVPGWNGQVIYCYDPTSMNKGTHGWPYIHQVWAYDVNDLLAVKNGTKNPWDLRPYATWKLSDINNNGAAPSITSATYDPATKKFYMAIGRDIHVYQVNVGTAPTTQQPTADLKANGSDLPVSINSGTAVTLSWSSTNATSCTVTGGYSGTTGTQSVTPTSSTTYTLSCTGAGGTASDSVSVTVNSTQVQSPTADIKANGSNGPISVPATSGVTLTWTSTNSTSCSVNPGAYTGLTGTQTTSAIEAGRTFTVSCTGAGGTASDSVVVNPSSTTVTDTTKPTVTLTAPSSYTAIKGVPILVSADATDNVGVVGVQFKLDGANLNTEDTTSAYSTIWDTTNVAEGSYTLTATARDAAGNMQTTGGVVVTISVPDVGDTVKPTVSITAPEYDSEVYSTVSLSADASDDTGVAGVQFKVDGVSILSEDNVEPYSITWNTGSVSNGSHSVTAVARDLSGNTQESSSVIVRVQNDVVTIVPPTVSLTSPSSSSSLSGTVIVSASASDDKGVAGVQFKLDGVNLLPEDTTAPYSISWNTIGASNGTHTLTATARDVEGNQTTSSGVSVSVNNSSPTPPPPTSLKVGDKVKTTAWVNVRSTAGGRYVGTQRTGKTGTITSGPGYANSLTWWKVNFTSGADGWVAANYLTKSTVAMTDDDYRKNIANIYLIIKYLQERVAGGN